MPAQPPMPLHIGSPATTGRVLTALGVLALSPDALLVRLVAADSWTIVWWRTVLAAVGVSVILIVRHRRKALRRVRESLAMPGLLVAPLFGTGTVCFVLSVENTAVANTLFLFAAAPPFGAFLSRAILKEHIRAETWIAAVAVLGGLALLFGDSFESGSLFGDACGLIAALCTSAAFVVLRRAGHANPMVLVAAGSAFAAVVATPWAAPASIEPLDALFLGLLGLVVLPVAFSLIFLGPRFIPAPEVGLLMLLEAALGPLWVWLVIHEAPSAQVAAAGVLIVLTLAVHSAVALRRSRSA